MALLDHIRNKAFWLIKDAQGSSVRRHLDDIRAIMDSGGSNGADAALTGKLNQLLQHATSTVPFYAKIGQPEIGKFPVINKNDIRSVQSDFLSSKFSEDQRIPAITSGSTGTPFRVYHDAEKKNRNHADTLYFAGIAGYNVGTKLYYLKIWSANNMKSPVHQFMQNIQAVDVIKLDDQKIAELLRQIGSYGAPVGLLGYASALELIAKYLEKSGVHKATGDVVSIISMSETLNDYTKVTLGKFFGVEVVSRYSNIENGIIAQQEVNGDPRFRINNASYYIEVLKLDSDEPATVGELGRIVVTDLYNYAMPMIRYDTGDIGALDPVDTRFFVKIEGRKLDQIYATNGELISSYIVYKNMWQYPEIQQYQFVQSGPKEYLFKINSDSPFERGEQLTSEFKHYLGQDASFTIEQVTEIPLLASGKRKKIMNTYHSQQ